jgi:hypothetical protein
MDSHCFINLNKRMLNIISKLISAFLLITTISTCTVPRDEFYTLVTNKVSIDTVYCTDTIVDTILIAEQNRYFNSFDDILLFATYLKTQSNRLDDDNWSVIHTLFNRMDEEQCTWREYFYKSSINHSATIKKLLNGSLEVDFSLKRTGDLALVERTISAYLGHNPTNVPHNVLYFESFKQSPNRGVFIKKNIWRKYRHKFYTGTLKSN